MITEFNNFLLANDRYKPNLPASALKTIPKPSLDNILKAADKQKKDPEITNRNEQEKDR